jgi:phytoene dehydrogenase-like protein
MRKSPLSSDYDVIIIGSGIGGLTCGAFLAKQGMRVAVLEQHFQTGGYAQGFSRMGYTFDSSVHSVSMADNGFVCGLLKQLGIRDNITTVPNSCTARVLGPSMDYVLPADLSELSGALVRDFPSEKKSVPELLSDMQRLFSVYKGNLIRGNVDSASPFANAGDVRVTQSYGEYIESFVRDKKLRYLLGSIWPFGGSSPSYAPLYNALIFIAHAVEGSHYIKGGFTKLTEALCRVITQNGGEVKTRRRVAGMGVDNSQKVKSVFTSSGEELTADVFVSNISPFLLHHHILPEKSRNRVWLRRLSNLNPSVSAVCVYLGMDDNASVNVQDNLTLWFGSDNHDDIYRRILAGPSDVIDHLLVMRPPEGGEKNTLTLINFVRAETTINWKEEKKRIADAMVLKATQIMGDFASKIRVVETASPATFERYTGNTGGACYGFENVKSLYGRSKLPFTTYLPNLYQAGHWTKSGGGIYNVMTSGYVVANMILKTDLPQIRADRFYPPSSGKTTQ